MNKAIGLLVFVLVLGPAANAMDNGDLLQCLRYVPHSTAKYFVKGETAITKMKDSPATRISTQQWDEDFMTINLEKGAADERGLMVISKSGVHFFNLETAPTAENDQKLTLNVEGRAPLYLKREVWPGDKESTVAHDSHMANDYYKKLLALTNDGSKKSFYDLAAGGREDHSPARSGLQGKNLQLILKHINRGIANREEFHKEYLGQVAAGDWKEESAEQINWIEEQINEDEQRFANCDKLDHPEVANALKAARTKNREFLAKLPDLRERYPQMQQQSGPQPLNQKPAAVR